MKLIKILLFLVLNVSYGQAIKQDKAIRASSVYGFFSGIESGLEYTSKFNPNLQSDINQLNYLLTTNFGQSKKNAVKFLNKIDDWEKRIKPKIDSIKETIFSNIVLSSEVEIKSYLKELELKLKGNIPSPLLENILSFQYENQPYKEFANGYTYSFNTKGHKKSKNTELIITLPKSWTSQEGKQPNVIQLFTSDCGNGFSTVSLMTAEMPYSDEDLANLSFEQIDKIYKEDVFSEEYAKNFIQGKFISYKPISIAGRAGFLVVSEVTQEKMGMNIKMRNSTYIFHDITYLHIINCGIGTGILTENLEETAVMTDPLFFMIANSIVVPKKDSNIIYLKGTSNRKVVDIKIADKTYDFILDTGASISLLNKSVIVKLLDSGIISKRNYLGKDFVKTADGKKHLVEFWNLPNIIVGGKKINDVNFAVMEGQLEPLLGMNIINKLNIWKIDLDNYKIHLKD
jgi:hypothetical protein